MANEMTVQKTESLSNSEAFTNTRKALLIL